MLAAVAEEAAQVADARSREARSVALRFHDQIKALREYDLAFQLNDTDIKQQSAYAAALIDDILTGGTPEPASFRSLAHHPERSQWLESMVRERTTLEERGTWEFHVVPLAAIGLCGVNMFTARNC